MEEWKEYKLGEIGTIVGGATPSTKDEKNYDGNIAWITPKDLSNFSGRFISRGERMISQKGFESSSCKKLPSGSILFSSRAPIGYVAIASNELCTNQGFKSIIPNPLLVNNIFIYYLLIYNKKKIEGMGSGTTFKEVSGKVMNNIEVSIPSLPTQQKIANILSSLDDKIEVNRRINEQLEELAQALFKSWFVDFEPFKDGEFVESELGMIPKGWRVCEIKDFGDVVCGKTPPKENRDYYGGNIPFIKIPDMHNKIFVERTEDWLSEAGNFSQIKKRIPPYSICVSCIATVGLVVINSTYAHTNQQINTIILNKEYERYYLFNRLKLMKEYIQNLGRGGTATLNVNTKTFSSIKVLKPIEKALKDYDNIVAGIFEKIEKNQQEITHLSNLRDALLPKLMSGEINVDEVKI